MPRRRVVAKREVLPDPKFHNQVIAKFINHVMVSGKKAVAERIVYGALDRVQSRDGADPIETFDKALDAIAPMVEVKISSCRWRDLSGTSGSTTITPQRPSHALACRQRSLTQRKVHGSPARWGTDGCSRWPR